MVLEKLKRHYTKRKRGKRSINCIYDGFDVEFQLIPKELSKCFIFDDDWHKHILSSNNYFYIPHSRAKYLELTKSCEIL